MEQESRNRIPDDFPEAKGVVIYKQTLCQTKERQP